VLGHDQDIEHLQAASYQQFRQLKIEPPTLERVERIFVQPSTHMKNTSSLFVQQLSFQKVELDQLLGEAKVLNNPVPESQSYFQGI